MFTKLILLSSLALNPAILTDDVATTEEPTTEVQEEPTTTEEDETLTQEQFTDKIKEFLEQYLSSDMVANVINWAINSGLLISLFGVYLKYRKYKSMSSKEIADEVEKRIKDELSKAFKSMSAEELKALVDKVDNFEDLLTTFEKALVLSQDKTAEGKKALLDLISEKTKSKEVVETATEVKEKVEEEQKTVKDVQKKVEDDYLPID